MIYQLSLKNITGVTGAHIHSGKQGENGPVVADLFNPSMTGSATGAINGRLATGTLTQSKLTGPLHGELSLYPLVNMIRSGEEEWRRMKYSLSLPFLAINKSGFCLRCHPASLSYHLRNRNALNIPNMFFDLRSSSSLVLC
jgi:CHRD domain